jgi:hypothetical protein
MGTPKISESLQNALLDFGTLDRKVLSLPCLVFTPQMFFTHPQLPNFLFRRTKWLSLETLKQNDLQYIAPVLQKLDNL